MKKISSKIILANIAISVVVFVAFFIITFTRMQSHIQKSIDETIEYEVEALSRDFDSTIESRRLLVLPLVSYLERNLTLEILKQDETSRALFDEVANISRSTVKKENMIDLYCWLIPEYINNVYGLSIRNYKLDGNITVRDPGPYTVQDISGEDWDWIWKPEETGKYITTPYDWDGIDGKVISYTEAIKIENTFVGIVGTDFRVDEFEQRLLSKKILETGYFAMADEKLNLIFHKDKSGIRLDECFPGLAEEQLKTIQEAGSEIRILEFKEEGKTQLLAYKKLDNGWYILGIPTTEEIYSDSRLLLKNLLITLLLSILLVISISVIIGKTISKPVVLVTERIKDISEGDGDLTGHLTVKSDDEIKILAESFNSFISKLKSIVINIKKSSARNKRISSELKESSATASTAADQIRQNVSSIKNQTGNLDNNIHEATSGIEEISSNVSHFKNQVDNQVSAVEQSSASVEEMISSLENVARVTNAKLESTGQLVEMTKKGEEILTKTNTLFKTQIAEKISNIQDMVDIISTISSRTNLLAMNAAIEAAHAGEAGKGFAVVADEVRKMAEESAQSSSDISELINIIVQAIVDTDTNIDNTATAFKEISTEVEDMDVALNEIAASTIELSTGGQEILTSVGLLNNTTSLISEGIKEIEIGAHDISDSMVVIKEISTEVNANVDEINNEVINVTDSFDSITNLSADLDDESGKLSREISRFIV